MVVVREEGSIDGLVRWGLTDATVLREYDWFAWVAGEVTFLLVLVGGTKQ